MKYHDCQSLQSHDKHGSISKVTSKNSTFMIFSDNYFKIPLQCRFKNFYCSCIWTCSIIFSMLQSTLFLALFPIQHVTFIVQLRVHYKCLLSKKKSMAYRNGEMVEPWTKVTKQVFPSSLPAALSKYGVSLTRHVQFTSM